MTENNISLENQNRALVLNTCHEISLLVDFSFFCHLFNQEYNLFKNIGLSDKDYQELSILLKSKLITEDAFYIKFNIMYDMFKEIALRLDTALFLDLFKQQENSLSFLNISDEKFKSLCTTVNDIRSLIIYQNAQEKKLFYKAKHQNNHKKQNIIKST